MKIFLSVGHSILKNGTCTSADGRSSGGVLEYEYCKQLAPYVKKYLEQAGHAVTLVICPEKQFTKSSKEKSYKIPIENKGGFDMACELHLNAHDGNARGCEVLYKSANGKVYADRVQAKLAQYFGDRGVQKRDNLYMLNSTKAPAIIVENFFCDSCADYSKAKTVGMDAIGRAIAEGIANKTLSTPTPTPAPVKPQNNAGKVTARVVGLDGDMLSVRCGAGTDYHLLAAWPKLSEGNLVDVLESYTNGWSKILIADKYTGFVNHRYLSKHAASAKTYTHAKCVAAVTARALNVRTEPHVNAEKHLAWPRLSKGDLVDVVESYTNGWSKILIAGKYIGYVKSKYLSKQQDTLAIW